MFFQFGILRIAAIIINGEVKNRVFRFYPDEYYRIFGKKDNDSDEPEFLSYSDFIPYIKLYFSASDQRQSLLSGIVMS